MRGVVLAGGCGTRLLPLTEAINKHLLPIGEEPMIFHPIRKLVEAGIDEILVVTGGNCPDGFLSLLKDGSHLGVKNLYYAYQKGAGGIAEALGLAKKFVGDGPFAVILGDNIFTGSLKEHVTTYLNYIDTMKDREFAQIFLSRVDDPGRFGCPELSDSGEVLAIIEKPSGTPPSSYAVIGISFYPPTVFDVIPTLKRSGRGEMEITDINNHYISKGKLISASLDGRWSDAGTWPSYREANQLIQG